MSSRESFTRQIVTVTVTARSTSEVPEDNGEDQPLLRSVASLKLVCDSGALTTARKEAHLQGDALAHPLWIIDFVLLGIL